MMSLENPGRKTSWILALIQFNIPHDPSRVLCSGIESRSLLISNLIHIYHSKLLLI